MCPNYAHWWFLIFIFSTFCFVSTFEGLIRLWQVMAVFAFNLVFQRKQWIRSFRFHHKKLYMNFYFWWNFRWFGFIFWEMIDNFFYFSKPRFSENLDFGLEHEHGHCSNLIFFRPPFPFVQFYRQVLGLRIFFLLKPTQNPIKVYLSRYKIMRRVKN